MDNSADKESHKKTACCGGIFWWTTLLIAVLAVPSFGIAVSYIFPFRGLGGLIVFVLACWLSTYLGMRLVANPKMSKKIGMHK